MSKRTRQYIGILSAIVAYYIVHEGVYLVMALIKEELREKGEHWFHTEKQMEFLDKWITDCDRGEK